jgi:hypothetical protein
MRDLVFISYAHEDEDIFKKLRNHLKAFKSNQEILEWSDQEIPSGNDWAGDIKSALSRDAFFGSQILWVLVRLSMSCRRMIPRRA